MADSIMEKVHFTTLSNGGAALGRLADGRVIFVKGILPDELALIRYFKTDSRFVTGELIDILEPSTRRIAPFCPLFGMCSGCQLQFLDYTEQLAEKMKILSDQLLRIGKIENSGEFLQPIIPSPHSSHYRKSIRFFVGEDGSLCLPTLDEKNGCRLEPVRSARKTSINSSRSYPLIGRPESLKPKFGKAMRGKSN